MGGGPGASSDTVGIESYEIYRNGDYYISTSAIQFTDTAPLAGTTVYTVVALDAEGNASPASNSWQVSLASVPSLSPPGLVLLAILLLATGHSRRGGICG